MKQQKIWQTIISLSFLLQALYLIKRIIKHQLGADDWMIMASVVMSLVLLFAFPWAARFYQYWIVITQFTGKIVTWIILAFIYFLVLYPTALIRRMVSKEDEIIRYQKTSGLSYFKTRNKSYQASDFNDPW